MICRAKARGGRADRGPDRGISAGGVRLRAGQKGQGARLAAARRGHTSKVPAAAGSSPTSPARLHQYLAVESRRSMSRVNCFTEGDVITPESLVMAGLIKSAAEPVKILGGGDAEPCLNVKATSSRLQPGKRSGGWRTVEELDLSLTAESRPFAG